MGYGIILISMENKLKVDLLPMAVITMKRKQVDFGTNRYFELNGEWYYAGNDGAILKGPQTIDGVKVYFDQGGVQVKGYFVRNDTDNKEHYYDKDSGALVTNNYVIAYDNYTHQNERYYVDEQGIRVKVLNYQW